MSTPVHLGMLVASVLVASSFPVSAKIATALDGTVLTALRFAIAAALFLPWIAWRHPQALRPSARALGRYAILSAPLAAYFVAMFVALRTTSAVDTGALFTLAPVFAALFSWWLLDEHLSRRRAIALLAGMVGAVWVVFRGEPGRLLALDLQRGHAIFLGGTAAFGLYAVLLRRLHRGEPMVAVTFWTLVTGTGWLLLVGGDELVAVRWRELELRVLAALAYLAVFTTLASFVLTQLGLRRLGPTRAMAYTYLNPALVVSIAWATGETIGLALLPGIVLTSISVVVLQTRDRGAGPPVPAPPVGSAILHPCGAGSIDAPGS